jgi:type IV secretory pathway VirB10-like protein
MLTPSEATPVPSGSSKPAGESARPVEAQPEPPRVPQFEEVIVPAGSVIGLQLETALSSDRARLEDRVEARVSRDVMAAGRVAIPVGARVMGSVIEIDKGGKVKSPARIGIRFHTLVLADGSEVALRTNPIYRDGESPAGNSAKKIGGAAIAGAILGGIIGGGKGAAVGGATGAAGGTAAVMSGERAAVNIPSGSFVTATMSSPATITVERRE